MNKLWLLLLLGGLIVASLFYKRWAVNYGLKRLYALRNAGNSEEFLQAVDSSYIRLHFSPFARQLMKLNYWIDRGENGKVEELLPTFEELKCSQKDRITFYSRALGYTLEKGRPQQAREYMDKLESLLKDKTDPQSQAIKLELGQLDGIYLKKDTSLIPVLEQLLEQTKGENASVICYRLARLYHAKGDPVQTDRYLDRALSLTGQEPSRNALRASMKDHSLLD